MTGDYQQAEDLTHETFIRAFNSYESFERKSEAKTWLFRIAHNVTVDYLRKNKPLRIIESFLLNKKDTNPLPEDILDMKENIREVYKAMDKKTLIKEASFTAYSTMMDEETGIGNPYWPYTFGACGVELDVNEETGEVNILNAVVAQDVGKAINPHLIEGQIDGGFAMGVGYTLMEDLNVVNGKIKNNKLSKYLIPTSLDTIDFKKIIVEDEESSAPFGAKGIGEPVIVYVAPAILNAISHAIGARINELPATPDKILKTIKSSI